MVDGLRQADLDAVRNHHDLLSVLYYTSPLSIRRLPSCLTNHLDYNISHAEVCKVGVRAWSNLVLYELSGQEPLQSVGPFATWFDKIVCGCAHQHRLAQSEAEAIAKEQTTFFSWEVLEANVMRNQGEIENVLVGLLGNLGVLLQSAKNVELACQLFETIDRQAILELDKASANKARSVTKAFLVSYSAYFAIIERQRCARLPSPLARSALQRVTIPSSL